MAAKLQKVFKDALGLPPETDYARLEYGKDPRWDSIAHMNLAAAIEKAFDILLETEDVLDLSSFEKAVSILRKHGVAP
jgi:acyl carrier protein